MMGWSEYENNFRLGRKAESGGKIKRARARKIRTLRPGREMRGDKARVSSVCSSGRGGETKYRNGMKCWANVKGGGGVGAKKERVVARSMPRTRRLDSTEISPCARVFALNQKVR